MIATTKSQKQDMSVFLEDLREKVKATMEKRGCTWDAAIGEVIESSETD
jgi:hypothetical protein